MMTHSDFDLRNIWGTAYGGVSKLRGKREYQSPHVRDTFGLMGAHEAASRRRDRENLMVLDGKTFVARSRLKDSIRGRTR